MKILTNEWGHLSQGNQYGVTSTNTIKFIPQSIVPSTSKVACATFVLDYHPFKDKPYRVRITVGGDISQYTEDA